jgi:nucleotidyltransferase substrate binding protein (TIGR01987 family)
MTSEMDIRWEQRFSNFNKALQKLTEAINYIKKDLEQSKAEEVLEEIIKEGLIQRFEYTYEMAWKVMKDYALYQGNSEIGGSRDAIRYAFTLNLISDGDMWMDMIKSRIKTSHTYNQETAQEIYMKILNEYYPDFIDFQRVMEGKRTGNQQDLFDKE